VQLERSDLRETIQRALTQFQIEPEFLQLELTEGSLFEKRTGEFREDAIAKLRELGVKIAIDDFGTGYSSLSYLKRWRVDWIKIDRSFVRDIVTDLSDHAIVSAIIAMARSLNIQVVAEGIEGWQQLEMLRSMGCQKAQGFLFAKPAPGRGDAAFHADRDLRHARQRQFPPLGRGRAAGRDGQLIAPAIAISTWIDPKSGSPQRGQPMQHQHSSRHATTVMTTTRATLWTRSSDIAKLR
jgi:predicted signal transduction protein with EAL and GGDEF domain